MNVYPEELVTHEAPLLVISGLGDPAHHSQIPPYPLLENGPHITSQLPCVTDPAAERLAEIFRKHDRSGPWAAKPEVGVKGTRPVFRIRTVGRDYRLPPRKANPPARTDVDSNGEAVLRSLHSPISPLSPDSPLFPDGVFSHIWLRKHQSLLPSVFVAFFNLWDETNDENLQNFEDNKVIAAINQQKKHFLTTSTGALSATSAIGSDELRGSGHRTKYCAVILGDSASPSTEDRLNTIRRNTGLTTNATLFFFHSECPVHEQEQFASSLLATLFPGAVEYYRELSKHCRRKRSRPVPPPTIPASRALSAQAWTLRYELKLGIMAEFRQEMDIAARNYETAYEKLFSEVFEATSSWSERWIEARLLSDILTLRMVRCFLWMGDYVGAKQRWSYHIIRMKDILNRKGKGTDTYGYAGWFAKWNQCLAELIQHGNLPVFDATKPHIPTTLLTPDADPNLPEIYAEPPPMKPGSRPLTAEDMLHHAGFYYNAAAMWIERRAAIVKRIQPEDGNDMYDAYLCPPPQEEPSMDHTAVQIQLLSEAKKEFEQRKQRRMTDYTAYRIAKLKASQASEKSHAEWLDIVKGFRSALPGYRKEGWWQPLEEALWETVHAAKRANDTGTTITTSYELLCGELFPEKKGWNYDFSKCLEGMDVPTKPAVVVRANEVVSVLSTSFTFESSSVCVGQAANSQITIKSSAHPSSAPLVFQALKIVFEGGLKTFVIHHDDSQPEASAQNSVTITDLKGKLEKGRHSLTSGSGSATETKTTTGTRPRRHTISSATYMEANANLSISPGETKVFELHSILREAGTAKVLSATFEMMNEAFEFDYIVMFQEDKASREVHRLPSERDAAPVGGKAVWWEKNEEGKIVKRTVRSKDPQSLTILPRPPKIEVVPKGLEKGVYINEVVELGLEVTNSEEDDAVVELDIKILGWALEKPPELSWSTPEGTSAMQLPYPMGTLTPSSVTNLNFSFPSPDTPVDCTLQITLRYHLTSDPETPISKTVTAEMPIINPFHATFDFSPRVHPDPWPNHFSIPDSAINADPPAILGITQRWQLLTKLLNYGEDPLILESWEIKLNHLNSAASCHITPQQTNPLDLSPTAPTPLTALLDIAKLTPEDRTPSTLDAHLLLHYRRTPTTALTTTTLPIPRLFIPLREPRVLLTARPLPAVHPNLVELTYTVENPTSYFLTFSVMMEASAEFAFAGFKMRSLQVVPVARRELRYRVWAWGGARWVRVGLKVVDRYFNKMLRVTAAGAGVRTGERGVEVWVPGVEEAGRLLEEERRGAGGGEDGKGEAADADVKQGEHGNEGETEAKDAEHGEKDE